MVHTSLEEAEQLLKSGLCDERVEQLTAVSLSDIIALRAKFASSPLAQESATRRKVLSSPSR